MKSLTPGVKGGSASICALSGPADGFCILVSMKQGSYIIPSHKETPCNGIPMDCICDSRPPDALCFIPFAGPTRCPDDAYAGYFCDAASLHLCRRPLAC